MGWDAYAAKGRWSAGNANIKDKYPELHRAFKKARNAVVRKAGSCDGYLADGGLDLSGSGGALAEMTGWSVYSEEGWTKEMVKGAWEYAKKFNLDEFGDPCYFWSAHYFLKTCAENNLSIKFSY